MNKQYLFRSCAVLALLAVSVYAYRSYQGKTASSAAPDATYKKEPGAAGIKPDLSVSKDYGGRGSAPIDVRTIAIKKSVVPQTGTGDSEGIFLSPRPQRQQQFISNLYPGSDAAEPNSGNAGYAVGELLKYQSPEPSCTHECKTSSERFAARTAPLASASSSTHSGNSLIQ